ncbi:MAG: 30S ribosomal protein S15 [bacterium]
MISQKKKENLIKKYKTHAKDTGSPEVQVAILTEEIKELTKHLQDHKKDHSSRRGLLGMVAQRVKLLNHLKKEDEKRYLSITKKLKIKQV